MKVTGPYPMTEKSVYQKTCSIHSSFDEYPNLKIDNRNSNVIGGGDMLIDDNLLSIADDKSNDSSTIS